jgi:hypothetical protein
MDSELLKDLEWIAAKARQVVMLNDSCHSGGAVTKGFAFPAEADFQIKAYPYPLDDSGAAKSAGGHTCGEYANQTKGLDLQFGSSPDLRQRIFHLGAAGEDEAAFVNGDGSIATRAWAACLTRAAGAGRSQLSGNELANCAQHWLEANTPRWKQTITPAYNGKLVLTIRGR